MGAVTITGYSKIVTSKGDVYVAVGEETETLTNFSKTAVTCDIDIQFTCLSAVVNNVISFHTQTTGSVYMEVPITVTDTAFYLGSTGAAGVIALMSSPSIFSPFAYISGSTPIFSLPVVLHRLDNTYLITCLRYTISNAYFTGVVTAYTDIYAPLSTNSENLPEISVIHPEFFSEWQKQDNGSIYVLAYQEVFEEYLSGIQPEPEPGGEDPYEQGGTTGDDDTEPTGGTGDYDNDSDDIPVPLPPTNTAVDSGFITLYNPTLAQIQALGAFMWSDLFDLDTFKKLFGDPMQAILGLSLVPVIPPQGSSVEVRIGNVNTGIYMRQISNQFTQHDFGTIHLNEYWGGYLDYSPYTQVEIYLPFIGVRPLSADDVMNKDVHLIYNIDLLSGACIAFILVNENVLYQFIGQCSCSVPITGNDWTNVINGVLGIAGAIGTTVATGGLTTPQAISSVSALASSVVSSKPRVEKSGSLSGMGGMLGVFSPYLIITRPNQALPAGQNKFQGYPSFITRTLGTLSGFTRVSDVHLEGFTCTDAEKTEIKQLLEQGVIF